MVSAQQATSRKTINVGIMTYYLTKSFDEYWAKKDCDLEWQQQNAKLERQNLAGIRYFKAGNLDVRLHNPDEHDVAPGECSFFIAGCDPKFEDWTNRMQGSGMVIARFSMFYGCRSKYSKNTAAESGYSLDIPKSVSTVQTMLTHEPFLEGILARDEQRINSGLQSLNEKLQLQQQQPVLATPYLTHALQIQRCGGCGGL